MIATQTLRRLAMLHLSARMPPVVEQATVLAALPRPLTKKTAQGSYQTVRWFWNVDRGDAPYVVLVALDHAPTNADDLVIAECYRIPRADLGGRRKLVRYRVARANRVGSFLDRFRVRSWQWKVK